MKKTIALVITIFTTVLLSSAQGPNNNYKIDSQDLVNILNAQGIQVFKFPFVTKRGEYISISYEIYEMAEKIGERRIIEDVMNDLGFSFDHHISRIYWKKWHRIYLHQMNDSLKIQSALPGITVTSKESISRIKTLAFNSNRTPKRIKKKRLIMWAYGNIKDSERSKSMNGLITCSTGLKSTEIVESYDYAILFYAERIKKKPH